MEKKKAFISGGSKGIGLAIARLFYAKGFEVIICARGKAALKAAAKEMPGLHTFVCDLSVKSEVKTLAKKISSEFGPLEVLVNNGGIFLPGMAHEEPDSVFETLMQTNIFSAYYLTKALVPLMKEKGRGTIINMGSVAGIKAYESGGSYCISKFAMRGFSLALREELKSFGIRVVHIIPGAVYTDSWSASDLPAERFIPPQDIALAAWDTYNMSERTVVEEIILRPMDGDI
jgi:NAD(P)-dependent dehydrogenase (short-subunit alcohol dehydrogenase family)